MKYRKLDKNGDYILGKRNEICEDTEAVAQAVKTRILLLYGEWWETPSDGTLLFENVFGHRLKTDEQPDEIDLVFADRINGTMGVSEITKFESQVNPEKRVYSAEITIKTIYNTEFSISLSTGTNSIAVSI